jgi:hypothetical protein
LTRKFLFGTKQGLPENEEKEMNEAAEPNPFEKDGYEAYDPEERKLDLPSSKVRGRESAQSESCDIGLRGRIGYLANIPATSSSQLLSGE